MKRARTLVLAAVVVATGAVAAPALAQDDEPTITVEPANVEAAGEHEFTVSGTGWTSAGPHFVLPCAAPESGDVDDVDSSTCDTANLNAANVDADGEFELTITLDVGDDGVVVAASDAGQTQRDLFLVTVGAAQGDGDGAAEGEDEELADTGAESGLLAIVGVAVIAGGAMVARSARRD